MNPDTSRMPALARAYLEDLDRALDGTENRAEVVDSIREHIRDAISGSDASEIHSATRAVIDELGPVERLIPVSEMEPMAPTHRLSLKDAPYAASAVLVGVIAWANPLVGGVLSAIVLLLSLVSAVRSRQRGGLSGFLVFAVIGSAIFALYSLLMVLFVLNLNIADSGPIVIPSVPE